MNKSSEDYLKYIRQYALNVICYTYNSDHFLEVMADFVGAPRKEHLKIYDEIGNMNIPFDVCPIPAPEYKNSIYHYIAAYAFPLKKKLNGLSMDQLRAVFCNLKNFQKTADRVWRVAMRDDMDRLYRNLSEYRTYRRFGEMLTYVARLFYHKPFNALLLYVQSPNSDLVLSSQNWDTLRRQPRSDAHPLIVLLPYGPVQMVYDYHV